jgi:hypothetical protein
MPSLEAIVESQRVYQQCNCGNPERELTAAGLRKAERGLDQYQARTMLASLLLRHVTPRTSRL